MTADRHIKLGTFVPPHHSNRENVALCMRRDLALCEHLDQLGYAEFWMGEHHNSGLQIYGSPELFIAAAAERTSRIKIGAAVISAPYHNPFLLADRIVQLDYQTQGRAMFGFGPGALSADAHMLGIPQAKSRDRMIESLDVITRLIDGETVSETTEWYELHDARLQMEPFTQPRPTLAVSSFQTPTGAVTAGKYDLDLLCAGGAGVTDAFNLASQTAAQHGRTYDRSRIRVVSSFHLAETREEAKKAMQFGAADWLEYLHVIRPPSAGDKAKAGDPVEAVIGARGAVVGTPDDALAALEQIWETTGGFGTLLMTGTNWMNFEATKRSYELFARYVLPAFTGQNKRRDTSLQWMKDNAVVFADIRAKATEDAMNVKKTAAE